MRKQKPRSYNGNQKHPIWLGVGLAGLVVGAFLTLWHPERVQSLSPRQPSPIPENHEPWWDIQAIDTMKTSRDRSREFSGSDISTITDQHAERIAATGATHMAVATPYDEEFLPILEQWVASARKYELNVWFRGNWSGWEQWFDYPLISREEHLQKTTRFLNEYQDLFADGDIFQACPECENGGPGDPRHNGDPKGHKQFLIDLHQTSSDIFAQYNKSVDTRLNSMNGDVARLIMDPETTRALGGLVVVDHYVESPEQLIADLNEYAEISQGQIVLGEFGAPIPDIHGAMTHEEQATWLDELFGLLLETESVIGMNYWTDTGSSTQLWNGAGEPRPAAAVVAEYYTPDLVSGVVHDPHGNTLSEVAVETHQRVAQTSQNGRFSIPYTSVSGEMIFAKPGFVERRIPMEAVLSQAEPIVMEYDFFTANALASFFMKSFERLFMYLLFRR